MKRNGQQLATLEDGHPRRMSDGKNAVRKMNAEQRAAFLQWMIIDQGLYDEMKGALVLAPVAVKVQAAKSSATTTDNTTRVATERGCVLVSQHTETGEAVYLGERNGFHRAELTASSNPDHVGSQWCIARPLRDRGPWAVAYEPDDQFLKITNVIARSDDDDDESRLREFARVAARPWI